MAHPSRRPLRYWGTRKLDERPTPAGTAIVSFAAIFMTYLAVAIVLGTNLSYNAVGYVLWDLAWVLAALWIDWRAFSAWRSIARRRSNPAA